MLVQYNLECSTGSIFRTKLFLTLREQLKYISHLAEAQLQVGGVLPLVTVEGSVDHQLFEGVPESSQQHLTHPCLRGVEYRSTRAGGKHTFNIHML